jgi:hypothetical protein
MIKLQKNVIFQVLLKSYQVCWEDVKESAFLSPRK